MWIRVWFADGFYYDKEFICGSEWSSDFLVEKHGKIVKIVCGWC